MKLLNSRNIPFFLAASLIIAFIYLSHFINLQQTQQLRQIFQSELGKIRTEAQTTLVDNLTFLERFADRWKSRNRIPKQEWEQELGNFFSDQRGFKSGSWLNASMEPNWVFNTDGSSKIIEKVLPKVRPLLERSTDQKLTQVIGVLPEFESTYFIFFVPVYLDEEFDGFFLLVGSFKEFWDSVVFGVNAEEYLLSVYSGDREIYSLNKSKNFLSEWEFKDEVGLLGLQWELKFWPQKEFMLQKKSPLSFVVLIAGILTACLLGLATYFAQKARKQAKDLKSTNLKLGREIEEHGQAREELKNY
jgi:sensor domain CHASE-containing protein